MTASAALAPPPEAGLEPQEPAAANVVTLRDGLPGFEQCRRFVVLQSADLDPLVQLVGVDGSRPSFLALDPRRVIFDYDMELSSADRARVEAAADEVLLWLAIVRLDDRRLLVNLRAPIVINPRRMLGLQLVVANSPYDTQYVLPVD